MNQLAFFQPLSLGMRAFGKCFLKLALFELIYKLITALLIRPLLSFLFQLLLTISGNTLAFNEDIFHFIFSLPGLLSLLILTALSTVLVYFEFAVIICLVQQTKKEQTPSLALAITTGLWSFRSLRHPSTILFALYSLVLLPLSNIGVTSSLIPDLNIPNHITGELSKFQGGHLLLIALTALLFIAFFWLLFVLPSMVTEHCSFWSASQKSISTIREYHWKVLGILAVAALAWMLAFFLPRHLSQLIFGVPSVDFLQALTQFGLSARTPVALLLWLLISLFARVMLTPLLLTILTYYYLQAGKPLETDEEAIIRISSRLYQIGERWRDAASQLLMAGQNALRRLWGSRFVQRFRWQTVVLLTLLFAFLVYQLFFSVYRLHDPLVVGHRGCAYAVENSLAAIDKAIQSGADYVEIDVQLSADGIPVVIHDTDLSRLTGRNEQIYNLTAEELQALTLTQDGKTATIPTLEDVLERYHKDTLFAIELKLHGKEEKDLVEETMRLLSQYPAQRGCMVFSQDYSLVLRLAERYRSDYSIGYCVYGNLGKMSSNRLRQMNIDFLLVQESMFSKQLVQAGRKAFVAIYVWTVNEPAQMQAYLDLGALALITDYPDQAAEILRARNTLNLY